MPCVYCGGRVNTRPLMPSDQALLGLRCPWCQGKGWRMVKKDSKVRDTPPGATFAASGAQGVTPESLGGVLRDDWPGPETPDAPTAPTAPTAPDGVDDII